MPTRRDTVRDLDLDERNARLARAWFAELRQRQRDEAAAQKDRPADAGSDDGDGPGLWDRLFGDGGDDCGDGGGDGGGD